MDILSIRSIQVWTEEILINWQRRHQKIPVMLKREKFTRQEGKEARIVRVYMEYNSASTAAVLNEVRVTGKESKSEVQKRPEINTVKYEESEYNVEITENDTKNEVYGIIERRLGKAYKDWFKLELAENPKRTDYDYFELSMDGDQVKIKGNDGVSLATGHDHYLKYFCQVNLSQVGDQADMPENKPVVTEKVFKETKAEVRYSYNYCTLSYSMAFWGEQEWRDELDWLALNGVNVVLDATAQEEVWEKIFRRTWIFSRRILKTLLRTMLLCSGDRRTFPFRRRC